MQVQRFFSKQQIALDINNEIASGGEGRIYAVLSESSLVAKIYHKPTDEMADKLELMYSMPPNAPQSEVGHAAIAWPIDLLCTTDKSHKIIGFLMPRVTRALPIHIFCTPKTRREQKPLFNYLYLHRTARNLAAAFLALHTRNYAIGDVNESNIFVTDTALVTLVDTDSFQVRDPYTKFVHRCPVGKPEFTPPELQGQTFKDVDRTPEHDLFGLAIIIFQLLMEGTHPFAGVYQGKGEPPSLDLRIKAGYFPYGTKKVPFRPMPVAPSFDNLHPQIKELFLQCFETGHGQPSARPDAKTWLSVLRIAEDELITCQKNPQHKYGNHLNNCPWCDRAKLLKGRDPFPSKEVIEKGAHLQPLKPKPIHKPLSSEDPRNPVPMSPTQTRKPGSHRPTGLQQKMGHYFPPMSVQGQRQPPAPPQWALPIRGRGLGWPGVLQDTGLGAIWGGLWLSAIAGILFIIQGDGDGVIGAIFVGTIWGCFFGWLWSIIMAPSSLPTGLSIFVGGLWGAFILAGIGGAIFGAIGGKSIIGSAIIMGISLGALWGAVWSWFKPPLSASPEMTRGKRGAFLGAIRGTFLGTLGGIFLPTIQVFWSNREHLELINLESIIVLIGTIAIASGFGAISGVSLGSLIGAIVGVPTIVLPRYLSGKNGALIGGLWGSFLGAGLGVILGVIFLSISTNISSLFTNNRDQLPLLMGIFAAGGIGAIWGLISGMIWGSSGRW